MILRGIRIFSDEYNPNEKLEEVFHIQAESMCSMFSSFVYEKKIRTSVTVINIECRSTNFAILCGGYFAKMLFFEIF